MIGVQFTKLEEHALSPMQAYPGDAGWDLSVLEDTIVTADETWHDVRSGIAIALPEGYYARLVARSSALRKKGLLVVEGIIDSGFRGELFSTVRLARPFQSPVVKLHAGESVCQIVIQEVRPVEFVLVDQLSPADRGMNGFGSSGR